MARIIKYGKDWLTDIKFPHLDKPFPVYYWDVWVVIVLKTELCNGDWNKLIDFIRQIKIDDYAYRNAYEQVRNQILFFQKRLLANDLKAIDIFNKLRIMYPEQEFINRHVKYVESKLLSLDFREKDKTKSMIFTPRILKTEAALRGNFLSYWGGKSADALDSQPLDYTPIFEKKFKASGFYNKDESWDLEGRLNKTLEKLTKKASVFDLFAIYRAFLTVVIEKSDMIRDSFGVIGALTKNTFKAYFSLDRSDLELKVEDYYLDLLNLMIWENYGYFYQCYPDVFKKLSNSEIETIEMILLMEKEELMEAELDYAKDKSLEFLGLLYSENLMFDKFVALAEELGTKNWMPIVNLAETAEKHQKDELAKAVYEAALKDKIGTQYKTLNKNYKALLERIS